MMSIENSEVWSTIFIFVGRTKGMAIFTDCSRAMDVLARTMFGTASEKMAANGINSWMSSPGAGVING
jgi:hypothetical protein